MDDKNRRECLLFRSHHRGLNEMDRIMGGFAEAHVPGFTLEQLDQYEAILDLADLDVLNWVIGAEAVPAKLDTEVMRALVAYKSAQA